jgi:hypothetical protein
MHYYNIALPIAKRNCYDVVAKHLLNSIAILFSFEARYDLALKYHFESLELRQRVGDKFEISVALHNIGLVYYMLSNPDKALSYYSKSLMLRKEINNVVDVDHLLLNIALCHIQKKEFDIARKFVDEAFLLCTSSCSEAFLTNAYSILGTINFEERNFSKAEYFLLKSYSIAKTVKDVRIQFDDGLMLSKIYIERKQARLAEKFLMEVEALAKTDFKYRRELVETYSQLMRLYNNSNDLKKRIYFQGRYIALRDSIFNEEVTTRLMTAESDYIERENKARIEAKNKIIDLNEEIMFRQQVGNIAFFLVALLSFTLVVILARRNRAKQIANVLLDQKVSERTSELRMNQELIQRAHEEKALLIQKTVSEFHGLIATIKGLGILGQKETDISKSKDCWARLHTTINELHATVGKLEGRETHPFNRKVLIGGPEVAEVES